MKKVVLGQPDTVSLESINNDSFVGVYYQGTSYKSIVVEVEEKDFRGLNPHNFDLKNSWAMPTKKEYVANAMNQRVDVYVFDTVFELLKWFSNED